MDILSIWSQKILLFIKDLWCKRNVDWHIWKKININKPEKRKKIQVEKLTENEQNERFQADDQIIVMILTKKYMINVKKHLD